MTTTARIFHSSARIAVYLFIAFLVAGVLDMNLSGYIISNGVEETEQPTNWNLPIIDGT